MGIGLPVFWKTVGAGYSHKAICGIYCDKKERGRWREKEEIRKKDNNFDKLSIAWYRGLCQRGIHPFRLRSEPGQYFASVGRYLWGERTGRFSFPAILKLFREGENITNVKVIDRSARVWEEEKRIVRRIKRSGNWRNGGYGPYRSLAPISGGTKR